MRRAVADLNQLPPSVRFIYFAPTVFVENYRMVESLVFRRRIFPYTG